jgi:hypothetical protein
MTRENLLPLEAAARWYHAVCCAYCSWMALLNAPGARRSGEEEDAMDAAAYAEGGCTSGPAALDGTA